ncbi:MAG: recombinase family protein [Patescibacteria group bacterium]|nr:recombinase family protein [Patescibacteria group bacterium]
MKVGIYARVSTDDQILENQLFRLRQYCQDRSWEYQEYFDHASGRSNIRPGLSSILRNISQLDGILVLRLDRFGRSLKNLMTNLEYIRDHGKFFMAIDQGISLSSDRKPIDDFMFSILGAAAQLESEWISERVRDGMARAKRSGISIGRPRIIDRKTGNQILKMRKEGSTYREISRAMGIKKMTIYNWIKMYKKDSHQKDEDPSYIRRNRVKDVVSVRFPVVDS